MQGKELFIKSLENFKEKDFLIHIIPFRFQDQTLQILLHQTREDKIFEDFSGFLQKTDINHIFSAARILLKIIKNQDLVLDLKELNWSDPIFLKYLGVVADCYDLYESEDSNEKIFFLEEKNINDIMTDFSSCQWFSFSQILSCSSLLSPDIFRLLTNLDIKNFLEKSSTKFYGILNCETNPLWNNIYEGLYQGYFQRSHEKWVSFKVAKGSFPSEEDIRKFNGWVVTGSGFSTYDESLGWLKDFFKLLNEIMKIKGDDARILGICFGHQALAKAFGGETEKMKEKHLMKQKIRFTQQFFEKDYVVRSKIPNDLLTNGILLNQSHGDHVCKLPPNAEILGFSDQTKVECFGIGKKVLGIQPHPEFSDLFMIFKLGWQLRPNKEMLLDSYSLLEIHNQEMIMICREFLKV